MNEQTKDTIKKVLAVLAVIGAVVTVVRKIAKWAEKYDDDSFKWDMAAVKQKVESKIHEFEKSVESELLPKNSGEAYSKPQPKLAPKPVAKVVKGTKTADLSPRMQKIYDLISQKGEATMQDISEVVTEVSNRTLRRDMTKLEELNLISHTGKTKNSIYRLLNR